jgi:hypothetical protein
MQLRFRSSDFHRRRNCPLLHRTILQDCFSAQVGSMFCRDDCWNGSRETKDSSGSYLREPPLASLEVHRKKGRSLSYALFPINGSCPGHPEITSRSFSAKPLTAICFRSIGVTTSSPFEAYLTSPRTPSTSSTKPPASCPNRTPPILA